MIGKNAEVNCPADIMVENGVLVNVFTRELQRNQKIVIYDDTIRYVGANAQPFLDDGTERIDAAGKLIIPGLIDAHNHLDSLHQNHEWARYIVPTGCTTVVTEMAMAANAVGPEMLEWYMESGKSLPLRIFYVVPPNVPPFPEFETSHEFEKIRYEEILRRSDVLGVGEAYWPMILDPNDHVIDLWQVSKGIRERPVKAIRREPRGDKLVTYAYRGATSCHESTHWEEALEKARLGYTVMIREGFVRRDLEAIAPVSKKLADFRNFMFVSDIFDPTDLIAGRGLQSIVEKAVRLGFDPFTAIQMTTLNPAHYFNLHDLGAVAPGKKADLFLADNFDNLSPTLVIAGGKVVAINGRIKEPIPHYPFPPEARKTIITEQIQAEDLRVQSQSSAALVKAVSADNETITREIVIDLPTRNGEILPAPDKDVVKMAVFNRQIKKTTGNVGFLHGTGLGDGAIATNVVWDTTNILVIGIKDSDMVQATNRLIEIGGGWTVSRRGEIIMEIQLSVFGLMGDISMPDLVESSRRLEECLASLGMKLSRPFLTLQTLPFTGLPFLRLTDKGLLDVRHSEIVPMLV